MIGPTADEVLGSVIASIEDEISSACDEYAASLCRTAAQMLRHVRARMRHEVPALSEDNADLRALLRRIGNDVPQVAERIDSAVAAAPPAAYPELAALQEDARHLRALLAEAIDGTPDGQSPVHVAAREYLTRQLTRQLPWQRDAYTGPRR